MMTSVDHMNVDLSDLIGMRVHSGPDDTQRAMDDLEAAGRASACTAWVQTALRSRPTWDGRRTSFPLKGRRDA
jgi:hypothetical protein